MQPTYPPYQPGDTVMVYYDHDGTGRKPRRATILATGESKGYALDTYQVRYEEGTSRSRNGLGRVGAIAIVHARFLFREGEPTALRPDPYSPYGVGE